MIKCPFRHLFAMVLPLSLVLEWLVTVVIFRYLITQTVDETFNEKERMFYQIEKTIKNFIKNATQYMDQFEVSTNLKSQPDQDTPNGRSFILIVIIR